MEVAVVGRQAISAVRPEASSIWRNRAEQGALWKNKAPASFSSLVSLPRPGQATCRTVPGKASAFRAAASRHADGGTEKKTAGALRNQARSPELFVGLPQDIVSDCNLVNHSEAVTVGLKALKLLGVDGIELPIWWGLVEKEAMGDYNWSGYLALTKMIQEMGLQVHASLCFHAVKDTPAIPLPSWVLSIGDSNPDVYFTNREGSRQKEYLSFAVDDLPVLDGRTPVQVFEDFCRGFEVAFSDFMGSTITDISVGLGPAGELRYPSMSAAKDPNATGVGEFQCYDKYMVSLLKQDADNAGNPDWGRSGPHDVPRCDQSPDSGDFFKEIGGSWDSPYGNFFLTWYSDQLLSHGHRFLSTASHVFTPHHPVTLSAKVPLMPSWYKTKSHPSELTAGYYNTVHRDGYDAVVEMFARNSCRMVVTGMDLSDRHQPQASLASPEALLSQIMLACYKHSVRICGENQSVSSAAADGFSKIKERILCEDSVVDSFTYQRMGAYFFSPEHWPKFTEFVRSVNGQQLHAKSADDQESLSLVADRVTGNRQLQAV